MMLSNLAVPLLPPSNIAVPPFDTGPYSTKARPNVLAKSSLPDAGEHSSRKSMKMKQSIRVATK